MKIKIYTAAAGNEKKAMEAGWSFVVSEQFPATGSMIMQYGGCTEAKCSEAAALAILEACYWCRDMKVEAVTIYSHQPQTVIRTFDFGKLFPTYRAELLTERNVQSDIADNLAVVAWSDFCNQPALNFDEVEVGDTICLKEPLYSKRMLVLAKLDNGVVGVKHLSTKEKLPKCYSAQEFNSLQFIKIR